MLYVWGCVVGVCVVLSVDECVFVYVLFDCYFFGLCDVYFVVCMVVDGYMVDCNLWVVLIGCDGFVVVGVLGFGVCFVLVFVYEVFVVVGLLFEFDVVMIVFELLFCYWVDKFVVFFIEFV